MPTTQYICAHTVDAAHEDALWGVKWLSLQSGAEPSQIDSSGRDVIVTTSGSGSLKSWHLGREDVATRELHTVAPPRLSHTFRNGSEKKPDMAHPLGIISVDVAGKSEVFDEPTMLTISADGTASLWNLLTGVMRETTTFRPLDVWVGALDPSGRYWCGAGHQNRLVFHHSGVDDKRFGSEYDSVELGPGFAMSLAYSLDGKSVAVGLATGTVFLVDAATRSITRTFHNHTAVVRSLSFSTDSRYLVSTSDDRTIVIYDHEHLETVVVFPPQKSAILCAEMSPDEKFVVSGSADGTVKVWDMETLTSVATLTGPKGDVWGVAWDPTERRFATANGDRSLRVWQAVGSANGSS